MVGRGLPHARGGYRPEHQRHGRKLPGNTPAKAGINEQVTPWVHGSGLPSTLIEIALHQSGECLQYSAGLLIHQVRSSRFRGAATLALCLSED